MQAFVFIVREPKKRHGNFVTKGVILTAATDLPAINSMVRAQMNADENAAISIQPVKPEQFTIISKL